MKTRIALLLSLVLAFTAYADDKKAEKKTEKKKSEKNAAQKAEQSLYDWADRNKVWTRSSKKSEKK